jgi:endoplasmic reticulum-Golgi intermediate compartment protein 2
MIYQYFISAVPTEIESLVSATSGIHGSLKTWQYSVRNQSRAISHQHGSHGIPGIYFK